MIDDFLIDIVFFEFCFCIAFY